MKKLSGGMKKTSRFQNKHINGSRCDKDIEKAKIAIGDEKLNKIKSGIDALIDGIIGNLLKENRALKRRIAFLEDSANIRIKQKNSRSSALEFLLGGKNDMGV